MSDILIFRAALWLGLVMAPWLSWMGSREAAPYGRHYPPRAAAAAAPHSALPTRLAWLIMESPPLLLTPPIFGFGRFSPLLVPRVLVVIFVLHYVHRALIYPFRMRPSPNRNLPTFVFVSGLLFNVYNTYIQVRSVSHFTSYSAQWLSSSTFLFGFFLFISGMAVNIWADSALVSLRKPDKAASMHAARNYAAKGTSELYKVPKGGLFEVITCPNYFGEIIEWLGWAIATSSFAGFVFLALSVSNLLPRALAHHRWFIENFPNYPRKRKALVPFIL
ncbi:hypothetical protein KP509_38G059000 [Ceratopteris richardii]|uniref:Steroid 5-alpha-reductase DET2 n=1 Tax=Ceratopteris richardii TaxID=49495 RepID=A0A8T2Q569_CERRI|nr:hypothetical protein KP509_38G059000 [Ceratopteris richardii]